MILEIVVATLLIIGVLFTAIPTVPGMLFMLVSVVVYGIIDKFETFDPWFYALFTGLFAAAVFSDYASGILGAKFGGASRKSILAGIIGLVIGFIFFPPLGLFIGLFAGVFAAEIIQFGDTKKALKAASYSFAGVIGGIIVNVLLAIAFLVSFLILVF